MLSQIDQWSQSPRTTVLLAATSSLVVALLFWFWERELLWMLAVLLPPIWSPVIYRRLDNDGELRLGGRAVGLLLAGLALSFALGVLVYLTI